MTTEAKACQHCMDPIVAARVYDEGDAAGPYLGDEDILTLGRALGRPQPYKVVWVREGDRRPYCWVPCPWEPEGHHFVPHKPMPSV